ncbi:MAG: magnesium transporter CorA [Thalassobius sp.]|nr:magnesium transporter CorA [Thalassovita sp.]
MIETVFSDEKNDFVWIDVINPTPEEYTELTEKYELHPAAVKDCLAPNHLPKYERIGDTAFIITRIYDLNSENGADTIQQLTNKVALFVSDEYLITIHRKEEPFITHVKEKWRNRTDLEYNSNARLLNQLLNKIIHTYDGALDLANERMDRIEKIIFKDSKDPKLIREMYIIKRRASVFKRMIFLTKTTMEQFARFSDVQDPFTQDLIDTVDSLHFQADELHENIQNLLNLHLALASHRTNEVMGVLTIVSMLFLPLTFIVGLYGMNFAYMPELQYQYSYFIVIGIMLLMFFGSLIWFKQKRWL